MRTIALVASVASLALASGCGSFLARIPGTCGSFAEHMPVYAGVAFDAYVVSVEVEHGDGKAWGTRSALAALAVIDLPASAVVDTALLPLDLLWCLRED